MRVQSKSAISYFFRNFGKMFFIALPVAVFAGFFLNSSSESLFVRNVTNGTLLPTNFADEFANAFSLLKFGTEWYNIVLAFVALCAVAFSMCMSIVKIDRHMHIGEMPIFPFGRAIRLFGTMLLFVLCVFGAMTVVRFVSVGVCYLLQIITNNKTLILLCVVSVLDFVLLVFATYSFTLLLLAFPLKYSDNYRFGSALAYSVRIMSADKKTLWWFTIFYPLLRLVANVVAYFVLPYKLEPIVYSVLYLFLLLYVPILAYKTYYENVGNERRDLIQIMFG